ncbi:hypothetical protein Agabi119p4_3984 [Agaricus bisporus var. burnettii]|uniref:Uncharacterized protein n=1 Tax=Agaricus bisporus var. burnettii TaxID=192524 RepID=A0A8H7F5S7_AGABI|nr:hypothetical protein Agabi119p4_3984 [Agaricus bisporus var. burnettii]
MTHEAVKDSSSCFASAATHYLNLRPASIHGLLHAHNQEVEKKDSRTKGWECSIRFTAEERSEVSCRMEKGA